MIGLNDPRNAIAWIFLGGSSLLAANLAAGGYSGWAIYGGGAWPGSAWTAAFSSWSFTPAVFVAPALVAQLFPDGRTLGGRWRRVFWITVAVGAQATLWALVDPGPTLDLLRADEPARCARCARQPRHLARRPRRPHRHPRLRRIAVGARSSGSAALGVSRASS